MHVEKHNWIDSNVNDAMLVVKGSDTSVIVIMSAVVARLCLLQKASWVVGGSAVRDLFD